MTTYIALWRGINVGPSTQVPMAQLKAILSGLDLDSPRTLLRSGNAVFDSAATLPNDFAATIESIVRAETGVRARVLLFQADEVAAIAAEDPLAERATDPSRHLIHFADDPLAPAASYDLPDPAELEPEALAVGRQAVYQWCPNGVSKQTVPRSFWKQFDTPLTARNRRTVDKLLALTEGGR